MYFNIQMYGFISCTVNDPPPVYTEKPPLSKSPEHLLVPRLSSVQEFQDEPVSPEETATHELDHTPITMATTQETVTLTTVQDTSSEVTSESATMTTNSELTNDPVSTITSEDVAVTTSSELTNMPVTITTVSSEADNPTTSSEVDDTITTTEHEENTSNTNNTVTIEVTPSMDGVVDPGEVEVVVTTNNI